LPKNNVICYRYLITCCAADAHPLFIVLQRPKGLAIENDAWISTRGKITLIQKHNQSSCPGNKDARYVNEPAFPYLY
jgi:putative membrane protein